MLRFAGCGRCWSCFRALRRDSVKHTLNAQVLIDVRPVHALTSADETEVCALRWGCFGQPP